MDIQIKVVTTTDVFFKTTSLIFKYKKKHLTDFLIFTDIDSVAFSSSHFGFGAGDVLLNNVACNGSEMKLSQCEMDASVSCLNDHSSEAGVRCQGINKQYQLK